MKKALAIFLLSLFLYNMLGYYAVFFIQQASIRKEITQSIDRGVISEQDLIVFKIPITLPYQSDRDFERVKGNFEYEGRSYEMVKKRLKNDTLYVYCINNPAQEQLKADLSKHTATHVGDLTGRESKSTTEKIIKNVIKDYLSHVNDLFAAKLNHIVLDITTSPYLLPIASTQLQVPSPPPKLS